MKISVMVVAIGALLGAVACGPERADYDNAAQQALNREGFENLSTSYDDTNKVLHVRGTVMTEAEREKAGAVARGAVAPGAQVANEVTVARKADTADDLDSGLSTRLDNLIEEDAVLSAADIDFDVKNGVVTITGRVASADQKDRVGKIASEQPGVKDVVNSLEIRTRS